MCDEVWDEVPAAPIHATPHFVACFVAHVVVYASSHDFVETALGQPYFNTKWAFMPALYQIPGFSTHPDHTFPVRHHACAGRGCGRRFKACLFA